MGETYDVIILGTGPAGITAGIYSARYARKTILIGEEMGGTTTRGGTYENWPGEISIQGSELMEKFKKHLDNYKVPIITGTITGITKIDAGFKITAGGKKIIGKTIIITLGTKHRKLEIPGEEEFLGKGVSYCATCDGMFFKGKDAVTVIGGADSAAKAALFLSDIAKQVTMIYRKGELRSEPIYKERISKKKNINVIYDSIPTEIIGDKLVSSIKIKNNEGKETELKTDGIFIEIGAIPCNQMLTDLKLDQDSGCYIKTDRKMNTNITGAFVAGDITTDSLKQVITGAGEGAIAAHSAHEYLQKQ
ncbi:FAD-dependent oxidoreductase [archaeon]|jgi:thioredoxin reductase (NADPH)|nr:FAD-dependent oxidoreductase [archaeon]